MMLCALVVSAVLLAGPSSASAVTFPRCPTAHLRLDKTGESDGLSHRGINFALRNVGPTTCQLKGYPSLRLLGSMAQTMPTTVYHFGGPPGSAPVRTVVVKPWHRAFFSIYFAVSRPCPGAVYAWGIRFVAPFARSGLVWYAGRFDLCGPGPAQVGVSPLRAAPQF
jgi:hypothetical protein